VLLVRDLYAGPSSLSTPGWKNWGCPHGANQGLLIISLRGGKDERGGGARHALSRSYVNPKNSKRTICLRV